jgi:hypothetical protein
MLYVSERGQSVLSFAMFGKVAARHIFELWPRIWKGSKTLGWKCDRMFWTMQGGTIICIPLERESIKEHFLLSARPEPRTAKGAENQKRTHTISSLEVIWLRVCPVFGDIPISWFVVEKSPLKEGDLGFLDSPRTT